ncbi:hypothetical protein HDV06_005962 [Boothiomyces sp. JEL0866]|nr:hypothetical protein HDV06_005962 [Boothiomyces sp. JEL0866]
MILKRLFSSSIQCRSMIGRKVLKYPLDVKIEIKDHVPADPSQKSNSQVVVSGENGTLSMPIKDYIEIFLEKLESEGKNSLTVKVKDAENKKQKAMWGTTRALIENMVQGVTEGFTIPIKMVGVGYRALIEDGKLSLKVGVSHPILMDIPEGVKVLIPNPQRILLQGPDLYTVSQFAANIRKWRKPEPYNQKGIFVGEETIKKKEGKKR